ncbi:hypothetical protein F503_05986 [Ophiostoma piceae UAMH 11346]|uniref:Uncharacterized protein n=1 Tax=Ophiostoma piceae (strain UAMH 11346) TaxID=1262450 RepID=S3CFI0_OPHP1|nr:hypothetical protein F503_05986 [Ophiostoma piceae UAMH 11346]
MSRIVLLCFVHGFKDLKDQVAGVLPDHRVETAIYPQLKQRVMDLRKAHLDTPWPPNDNEIGVVIIAHSMGGFVAADALFLALDERRERIASEGIDTTDDASLPPMFPPIQGLLAFDTPYNGLSRSMFVYGAFSNYSKIQTVFNVMTAISAGPLALGKLAMTAAGKPSAGGADSSSASIPKATASSASSRTLGWRAWQLVAVRTGTVGAIAAGGVAAYTHRKAIVEGVKKMRSFDRQSLREGYQSGVDAIGQGLAYVNRRSVGASFVWLSEHFTFVGALVKQAELNRRLQRLASLQGVGVHDVYISLGANGYWSGGYFVPERTFCAIPEKPSSALVSQATRDGDNETRDETETVTETENETGIEKQETRKDIQTKEKEAALFERWTMSSCGDEVQAHVSMFKREKNAAYDEMTRRAAVLAVGWLENIGKPIIDDVQTFVEMAADAQANTNESSIHATEDGVEIDGPSDGESVKEETTAETGQVADGEPDTSPIDIAATASLMARDQQAGGSAETAIVIDDDDAAVADIMSSMASSTEAKGVPAEDKANYLRHLLSVAQNAGTGIKRVGDWSSQWSSQLPSKMVRIDGLSRSSIPAMPSMPTMPSMPSMTMPTLSRAMFSRKDGSSASSVTDKEGTSTEGTPKAADAVETSQTAEAEVEKTPQPLPETGFMN